MFRAGDDIIVAGNIYCVLHRRLGEGDSKDISSDVCTSKTLHFCSDWFYVTSVDVYCSSQKLMMVDIMIVFLCNKFFDTRYII